MDGMARARIALRPAIIAEFGARALEAVDLEALLQGACHAVATGLGVERAKVLEYRPAQDDLLVRAGVGWKPEVVGRATLGADWRSPAGRAFRSGDAVPIGDLR